MSERVIAFAFWGRRDNVELQLPYIRRILADNPNVEFHGWDLARDPADSTYLRTIRGERIHIRTDYYSGDGRAMRGQNQVWKHYATYQYKDTTFVKLDDDDVFLQTETFPAFIQAARDHPDTVVSALTINNGASTPHIPGILDIYQSLNIPLLDVHLCGRYAEESHRWFLANWQTLLTTRTDLIPTNDWVSINCLALSHQVLNRIATGIGTPSPAHIGAGREFPRRNRLGDEGAANTLPRLIHPGFVCAHLNFGPQTKQIDEPTYAELRKGYADLCTQYLT